MNFGYNTHSSSSSGDGDSESHEFVTTGDKDRDEHLMASDDSCNSSSVDGPRQPRRRRPRKDRNNGTDSDSATASDSESASDPESSDPSSNSSFSDDVELVVGETAQQALAEPLVEGSTFRPGPPAPQSQAAGALLLLADSRTGPAAPTGSGSGDGFLEMVRGAPSRHRSVALAGHLHHGKTALLALLLKAPVPLAMPVPRPRDDEVRRGISVKSALATVLASGAHFHPAAHLMNFVDTPGHTDFAADTAAALRLVDAVMLCVDAVESLTRSAAAVLRRAVLQEGLPVVLVITKIDRLILELKLPPLDAYRKLRIVVDAVNNEIAACGSERLVSPINGTVCFSSAKLGCFFTTETFALKYSREFPRVDTAALSRQLWGQNTFEKGRFVKITNFRQRPTFVSFVLEPLYKIVAHALTGKGHTSLSRQLHPLPRDPVTAAREAVQLFCGNAAEEGIDALLNVLPETTARSAWLRTQYRLDTCIGLSMNKPNHENNNNQAFNNNTKSGNENEELYDSDADDTVLAIAPLHRTGFDSSDKESVALVRVLRGTLRRGMRLVALDEHSSDAEPFHTVSVTNMMLAMPDARVPVDAASAGQIIAVSGLSARAGSHVILVGGAAAAPLLRDEDNNNNSNNNNSAFADHVASGFVDERAASWLDEARVLPLGCARPVVHVGLELKDAASAPRLQRGLQLLARTTPGLDVHKEETGEFTLSGYGELHLDTALHELRRGLCHGVRVGLSQPFVSFAETVLDAAGALAVAGPRRAQLGCAAGALAPSLASALERAAIDLFPRQCAAGGNTTTTTPTTTTEKAIIDSLRGYGMDALDARHVVAAGPDAARGPSLLIDDTLSEERTAPLTARQLAAVAMGFRSAVAAGPLTGDVVRGAAVRLIFADIEADARDAVVLSSARSCVKQALLGARPRLMEPVLAVDITCQADCTERLAEILQMRRGSIVGEEPIAATTLVCVRALVPAIDSFGLETQMRMLTQGEAFPLFSFDGWDIVPGDPFDATIHVGPLEPARGYQLARDFTLKTRFRKGLPPLLADFQV